MIDLFYRIADLAYSLDVAVFLRELRSGEIRAWVLAIVLALLVTAVVSTIRQLFGDARGTRRRTVTMRREFPPRP